MPNEYSDLINEDQTSDLKSSLFAAAQRQPDVEAKLQKLSQRTGLPVDAIRQRQPEVELHDRLESFDYEKVIKESPRLSSWLSDPKNASVAHDDWESLSRTEKLLTHGKDYAGAFAGGLVSDFAGTIVSGGMTLLDVGARAIDRPIRSVFGDRVANTFWYEPASVNIGGTNIALDPLEVTRRGGAALKQLGNAMKPPAERQTLGTDVAAGIAQLGGQIALALTTGGTGTVATMYAQGADIMAEKTKKDGADSAMQDTGILIGGGITAYLEKAGVDKILNRVPPAIKNRTLRYIADAAAAGGIEAAQEITEGLLHDLTRRMTTNPEAELLEGIEREASAAAISAAIVRSALGIRGYRQAQQEQQMIEALAGDAKASELRKRLPERYQDFIAKLTENGPVQNVFIPAERFNAYFQSQNIDPAAVADELGATNYAEALAAGTDIVIPMGGFATHLAPSDHLQGLREDIRLSQDSMTMREARLAEQNREPDEFAAQIQEEIAKLNAGGDVKLADSIERIVGEVQAQLETRYDPKTARDMATVMRGVAVIAQRAFPEQDIETATRALWDRYGMTIRANPLPDVLRTAPDFDAAIDPLLDRLRNNDVPTQQDIFGESLIQFLRSQGGLQDMGGELARRDADKWDRENRKGGERRLVSDTGLTFDAARELAGQYGFDIGQTEAEFIDMIDREIRGEPVFRIGAGENETARIAEQLGGLSRVLSDMGIDLSAMDNAAVKRLLMGDGDTLAQQSTFDDVKRSIESLGVDSFISERGDTITVSKIVVPKESRSTGIGSAAMQQLVDYADATGKRIVLTPSSDFGGTKKRLVEFYRRFGFVENKGKNKDFTTMEAMVREPRAEAFNQSPFDGQETATTPLGDATEIEVDGVMRPALNSNGQPIHWSEEGVRNFWRWFGSSRVVDSEGRPLVVYHGTAKDFAQFDVARLGDNTREESGELGFFFTAKNALSDSYAEIASRGGWAGKTDGGAPVVYPVYLKIENPKTYETASAFYRDADAYKGRLNEWREELKAQGFDGVVVRNDFEEVIVFSPTQIKSATGNRGTFSPEDGSILNQAALADTIEVDGVVRPTTNSNGNQIHPTAEGIRNFWRWFGESKVVDSEGRPLVVYHGTTKNFTSFDRDRSLDGGMLYFTDDTSYASGYLSKYKGMPGKVATGANIMPVFLSIQNPATAQDQAAVIDSAPDNFYENPTYLRDELTKRGFDGLIRGREIVAFSPTQIKSATGNRGTFSPEDGSILNQGELPYQIDHKPMTVEGGASTLDDLTGAFGEDIYGKDALQFFGSGDPREKKVVQLLKTLRGKPDAMVTIYRGVPSGAMGINPGDWVTLSKEAAQDYADQHEGGQVVSMQVPAAHVTGWADSLLEFGYYPPGSTMNQGGKSPRAEIHIAPDRKMTISLFEKADFSSFLHETGHFYLEVMGDLADDPNASQSIKDEYAKILNFLGVKNRSEIEVKHHEKFARANEAYLMEGKAPAPELRAVFQRFKAWLTMIYRTALRLDVKMTDEIRSVFDRIYATDAEIQQASELADIPHLFADAAQAGMTEAEFNAYSEQVAQTTEAAKEELQTKLMRVERLKREAWWRDQLKKTAEEVAAEYDALPAAQAFAGLTAADSDIKLNRKQLTERYGEQITKQLPRGYGDGRGAVYSDEGTDIDAAAETLGYNSADELVTALRNLPNRKRYVAAEAERRIMEQNGDLLNSVALADAAMEALHNEQREKVLRIEMRAIRAQWKQAEPALRLEREKQRTERRAAVDVARMPQPEQLRQIATGIIGQKQVRDISPYSYLLAERKAAKAAFEAMAKRDLETAAVEKQRELLNHYLYKEATKAKQEADAIYKYMKTFEKTSMRQKLGKAGADYLDQIDGILERYEFTKATNLALNRRQALLAWMEQKEANGEAVNIPESVANDARRVNYRAVPMDELRAVRDAVKNIAHLANLKTKLMRKGEMVDFGKVVSELLDAVEKAPFAETGEFDRPNERSMSLAQKGAAMWRKFDAAHMKVEQLVEWLDGGDINGPWARYFFDQADAAQSMEYDLHAKITQRLQEIHRAMPSEWQGSMLDKTGVVLPGINGELTRYDLVSIAFNMGNAQNIQRLRDGYRWSDEDFQRIRDAMRLQDWQFVQSVWDTIELLWEPMAALEKRASGLEPEKVQALGFEAYDTEFRGGYFPLVYDRRKSSAGEKQANEAESVESFISMGYGRASTNKGATKTRVEELRYPVLLDYEQVLTAHTAKVVKDISHREAVISIAKILSNQEIKEALINKVGEARYLELRKWMQTLIADRADTLASATGGGKWLMKWRTNTAIVTMGFKISTMLSQFAGWGPSLDLVKPQYLAGALRDATMSPVETWKMVAEKSGEMRNRSNTIDRDVKDALLRLRGDNSFTGNVRRHAFILTAAADRIVSVPTWLGAYRQELANGGTEESAIRAGDRAVRMSQGGGGAKDLAAVQRNNELMRLITMYYTPFSVLYSRLRDVGVQSRTRGAAYAPIAAARILALVLMPAVMGDLLAGRGPDEEEDETWWAIRKMILYPFAAIPVVRDLSGYLEAALIRVSGEGEMKFPPGYKLSPIVGSIEKTARTMQNIAFGSATKEADDIAWDALEVSGYIFGLPTQQARITGEYIEDLMTGDADAENAFHDAMFRRDKRN